MLRKLGGLAATLAASLYIVSNAVGVRFANNRFYRGDDAGNTIASAARTVTGNSGALDASGFSMLAAFLNVTAASGTTPSMTVSVEESNDGSTWRAVGSFAAKTAVSNERKSFAIAEPFYRYVWTISGTTPSFTFTIDEAKK